MEIVIRDTDISKDRDWRVLKKVTVSQEVRSLRKRGIYPGFVVFPGRMSQESSDECGGRRPSIGSQIHKKSRKDPALESSRKSEVSLRWTKSKMAAASHWWLESLWNEELNI